MPARRKTYDAKCEQADKLQARVDELEAAIRELGQSGALGRLANKLNGLEQQLADRNGENAKLASELETALAALGARASGEPWIGEQDSAVAS